MQPGEWLTVGGMWGIVVALVAYVWHDLVNRVNTVDHPVNGKIAALESELRKRFHAIEHDLTAEKVRLEESGRDLEEVKTSLKEVVREVRAISSKIDQMQGRLLAGRHIRNEVE